MPTISKKTKVNKKKEDLVKVVVQKTVIVPAQSFNFYEYPDDCSEFEHTASNADEIVAFAEKFLIDQDFMEYLNDMNIIPYSSKEYDWKVTITDV